MTKVSISEAARLAGVSRQHLYKKWITPGLLTVEKTNDGSPMIDTSELIRVFGELKSALQPTEETSDSSEAEALILRRLLADRDTQLHEARERELWLRNHIGEVTGTIRLLEYKPIGDQDQVLKLQSELEKVKKVGQQQINTLLAKLEAEQSKGFWAKIFNREN